MKREGWLIVLGLVLGFAGGWMAGHDRRAELAKRVSYAEYEVAHLKKINGHLMKSAGGHLVNACPVAGVSTITISGAADASSFTDYGSGDPNGTFTLGSPGSDYYTLNPAGFGIYLLRTVGSGWRIKITDGSGEWYSSYKTPDGATPPTGNYGGVNGSGGTWSVS